MRGNVPNKLLIQCLVHDVSLVDDDYHELLLNSSLKTHWRLYHGEHSLYYTSLEKKLLQILNGTLEVQMEQSDWRWVPW